MNILNIKLTDAIVNDISKYGVRFKTIGSYCCDYYNDHKEIFPSDLRAFIMEHFVDNGNVSNISIGQAVLIYTFETDPLFIPVIDALKDNLQYDEYITCISVIYELLCDTSDNYIIDVLKAHVCSLQNAKACASDDMAFICDFIPMTIRSKRRCNSW